MATQGWKTWWIILALIVGLAFIAGFFIFESRITNPMMPLGIWRIPQLGKLLFCFGLGFGTFQATILFGYALYFQQIKHTSPIMVSCFGDKRWYQTALYLLPACVSGILTNVVGAFVTSIVSGRVLMVIGLLTFCIAALLGALQPVNLSYWSMSFPAMSKASLKCFVNQVIGVIGADITYLVVLLYSTTHVSASMQSVASGIVVAVAATFGALYTAINVSIITGFGHVCLTTNWRHGAKWNELQRLPSPILARSRKHCCCCINRSNFEAWTWRAIWARNKIMQLRGMGFTSNIVVNVDRNRPSYDRYYDAHGYLDTSQREWTHPMG